MAVSFIPLQHRECHERMHALVCACLVVAAVCLPVPVHEELDQLQSADVSMEEQVRQHREAHLAHRGKEAVEECLAFRDVRTRICIRFTCLEQ